MLNEIKLDLKQHLDELKSHEIYHLLTDISSITIFMEIHVYSVWDFMNLLKTLQHHLTCTKVPWKPKPSPNLSRLINEITLEEESDIIDGAPTSHFMYYVNALNTINPNIQHIKQFAHWLFWMLNSLFMVKLS